MSVLATVYSVIVHRRDLEELYPGGTRGFEHQVEHGYCSDGELCRAAFMSRSEAWCFAERLADRTGLVFERHDGFVDIAVTEARRGTIRHCDWLDFGYAQDGNPVARDRCSTAGEARGGDRHRSQAVARPKSDLPLPEAAEDEDDSLEAVLAQLLNTLAGLMVSHFNHREQALADGYDELAEAYDDKLRELVGEIEAIVSELDESNLHGLYLLGLANCFAGYWEEGERLLLRCTVVAPEFSGGWEGLAFCAQMMGKYRLAERASRRMRRLEPASALACHYHAESLAALGRYDEALSVAMDAVALDPSDRHRRILTDIADTRRDSGPRRHA